MRIHVAIARSKKISRRKAEVYLSNGVVTVNGQLVTQPGSQFDPDKDVVKVNGKRIVVPRKEYIIFNKPAGCLSTHKDPNGRRTIFDFKLPRGLFIVGRLDWDAEGLMLLTNDGQLAERVAHPRYRTFKTYHVKVKGAWDNQITPTLQQGVPLPDGPVAISMARVLSTSRQSSWLEIRVHEGRQHVIKRIFAHYGYSVVKLKRVAIATIRLGDLKPGHFRKLSVSEQTVLLKKVAPVRIRS